MVVANDATVKGGSYYPITGKSLSEALLFAEHGGEHVVYKNCSECQKQYLYLNNMFSPGLSLEFSCIELVFQ